MRFIKIILLAVIVVLVIALVIQNQEVFTRTFDLKLDLNFYRIGPYITSNLVLIASVFLIGVFFAVLWGALYTGTKRADLREKDRRIKDLEVRNRELERQREEAVVYPSTTGSPFKSPEAEREEVKKEENKSPFGA